MMALTGRMVPSPDGLNFLASLLKDVLDGLTLLDLWAGRGQVSDRLLDEGASRALCVDPEPPEDRIERDEMIWIPTDPLSVLSEDRGDDVGLVYSAAPDEADFTNRDVLNGLKETRFLERNCLVILAERPFNRTQLQNFKLFEEIESRKVGDVQLTVAQMIDPMDVEAS